MSEIVSVPQEKPVPSRNVYSTVELELLVRYSRASYRAKFGVQAPKFDPNWPVQRCFDTSADPAKPYTFLALNKRGLTLESTTIPGARACVPNLPGTLDYTSWKPAPSRVQIRVVADGRVTPVTNANTLSTAVQASRLADELDRTLDCASSVNLRELSASYEYVYPPDDPRRIYDVTLFFAPDNERAYNVGLLLQERYRAGVDAPGKWLLTQQDEQNKLIWVPDVEPTYNWNDLPEVAIPMRALHEDEELFYQFGGNVGVRKKVGSAEPSVANDLQLYNDVAWIRHKLTEMFGE